MKGNWREMLTVKYNESLKRFVVFLRSLVRHRDVEAHFKSLEKTAESEEAKNARRTERIALKKREFELKQRILEARGKGKKLEEEYLEYDPKAAARRTRKIYGMLALGMVLFFMLLKACTNC